MGLTLGAFLIRRLINYLLLTFIATSLAWVLASMTMSPKDNYLAKHPQPSATVIANELNLRNENPQVPLYDRYEHLVSGVVKGDFGVANLGETVSSDFVPRLWVTLRLVSVGTILSALVGVSLGAFAAVRQYKFADRAIVVFAFVVQSIPVFVMAILLEIGATDLNNALGFRLLKFTSEYDTGTTGIGRLLSRMDHLILPSILLTLVGMATYTLYQRNTMLDALGSDFLRTARAKGLTKGQAIRRHGLRTAIIPVMTLVTYGSILAFTGAFFTEIVFGWHGLGEYAVQSIGVNDVNSTAAVTMFSAVLVLIAGMLSDVVVAALDPRVRL